MTVLRLYFPRAIASASLWLGGTQRAFDSFEDAVEFLELQVTNRLLSFSGDRLHIHASACRVGGGAVLAFGESGAGKSSLAVQWLAAGYPVYGDDIVMMNQQSELEAFKRLLNVHPEVARAQGLDLKNTTMWLSDSEEAWIDPETMMGWAEPSPVRAVVLVRFDSAGELSLEPLKKSETLNLLMSSLMPSGVSGAEAFGLLSASVSDADCFVVRHRGGADVGEWVLREVTGAR